MTWPRAEPSSHAMSCTKLNALYLRIPDRHCSVYRHIRLEWSSFHSGLDRDCAGHALSPSPRKPLPVRLLRKQRLLQRAEIACRDVVAYLVRQAVSRIVEFSWIHFLKQFK